MWIEDIEAIKDGRQNYLRDRSAASDQLARYGVTIIRNAFDPRFIRGLLDRVAEHRVLVEAKARAGLTDFNFDDSYLWNPRNLGCELTALDPLTSGRSMEFPETSLYRALRQNDLVQEMLRRIGDDIYWWVSRVRVVLSGNDGKPHGRLSLHAESAQLPHLDGLHNIWTPLVAEDVTTNIDCPGIQFYIGRLQWFEQMSTTHADKIVEFLDGFKSAMTEHTRILDDDGSFFYRPTLRTGDLAMFSGAVPHTAYVPPTCKSSRVNFDVRLFRKSDEPRAKLLPIG